MRTTYPFLIKDEGILFSHLVLKLLLHLHEIVGVYV